MKTAGAIAALVALGCAHGFVAPVQQATTAMRPQTKRAAERVNESIELEKPKVVTMDSVDAGSKKVYCRCWKSATFPLCDGKHMDHNKATGDNLGPLIVSGPK
eukprot:jgi/Undpi1/6431/HiC_scaffold_20.g08912.m1